MNYYIGLDVGGTKCAAALGTQRGEVLCKSGFKTDATEAPQGVLNKLCLEIETVCREAQLSVGDVTAIGISCGGPLDTQKGLILSPPNLPLWDKVEIVRFFETKYAIPTFLQNDANACAIAEWRFGAGKGTENMIFLTFGTGMGAGLILDGRLYCGKNGLAGEVGHISLTQGGPVGYGKKGSFEGYCSGAGIRKIAIRVITKKLAEGKAGGLAQALAWTEAVTAKDVCIAAEAGDKTALEIIQISAKQLGCGLAVLIDILNPEMIVIGSVFARSEHLFRATMQKYIDKNALTLAKNSCKVVPAKLMENEQLGDVAALTVGMEGLKNSKRGII